MIKEGCMKLIYIADDEKDILLLLESFLKKEGYEVCAFETGDDLWEAFQHRPADLVISDLMMPGINGLLIVNQIRNISKIPIIVLTAKDSDSDYIAGFSMGCDDYFTKPFSPLKLILRVRAIFAREGEEKEKKELCMGNLKLNPEQKTGKIEEREIYLTNTEFGVLAYLMEQRNRAVSREELLDKIWGIDAIIETRATDDAVKRLRKKLREQGCNVVIETVWGYGFKIKED